MTDVINEVKNNVEEGMGAVEKIMEEGSEVVEESSDESKAEAESSGDIEDKKKALLERVKKLKEKVDVAPETEDLKEQVKVKKTDMLFTKKYPAGILTNTQLPDFFENELTIVTDSWVDKNALNDTLKVGKKVLMICDTNNFSKGADCFMIGNNKGARSLGLIFYLLTRGYMKAKEMDTTKIPDLEWWMGELDEKKGAKKGV
jgi:ribosomal protein S2